MFPMGRARETSKVEVMAEPWANWTEVKLGFCCPVDFHVASWIQCIPSPDWNPHCGNLSWFGQVTGSKAGMQNDFLFWEIIFFFFIFHHFCFGNVFLWRFQVCVLFFWISFFFPWSFWGLQQTWEIWKNNTLWFCSWCSNRFGLSFEVPNLKIHQLILNRRRLILLSWLSEGLLFLFFVSNFLF